MSAAGSNLLLRSGLGRSRGWAVARRGDDHGGEADTGRRAGGHLSRYARSHGVEIGDALAAAASTTGLHPWTLNRKHYPMETSGFTTHLAVDEQPGCGRMTSWTEC